MVVHKKDGGMSTKTHDMSMLEIQDFKKIGGGGEMRYSP